MLQGSRKVDWKEESVDDLMNEKYVSTVRVSFSIYFSFNGIQENKNIVFTSA